MTPISLRRLALVAAMALVLASCGSSGAPSAPTTATPTPTPTPLPSIPNVANAANGLSSLTSYKYTMTTSGGPNAGTATTIVVRQPTPAESFTATFAGHTLRIITIGTTVWVDEGTGTFVQNAIPASLVQGMTSAFDPGTFLTAANSTGQLSGLQIRGVEQKNGVSAIHLHGDHSTVMPAGQTPIPAGASFDLWIASSGGYLVALEFTGMPGAPAPAASTPSPSQAVTSVSIEVTNVNDPSLSVSPPS